MESSGGAQSTRPRSSIGEDLTITGTVTSKGELHLDGQVQGDVRCVALVLGENAQLEGDVVAEDVIVRGRLIGSVRATGVIASQVPCRGQPFSQKSLRWTRRAF